MTNQTERNAAFLHTLLLDTYCELNKDQDGYVSDLQSHVEYDDYAYVTDAIAEAVAKSAFLRKEIGKLILEKFRFMHEGFLECDNYTPNPENVRGGEII